MTSRKFDTMLTQTQLKETFLKYDFKPLKRFGENYLIDANVKDRIIREANIIKDDAVLEIGPGFGALTVDLASTAATVFAVEKDRKAFPILKELIGNEFRNLRLYNDDILEFNLKAIFKGSKLKLLGNLPYYITTPIIEYIIENRRFFKSALIVVQKEVASRLLAEACSADRASISCFVQYYTRPAHICTIPRNCFYPMPDVSSSLLRLDILERPSVEVKDEELFFRIIRGAFNQRRKSIINSLSRKEVLDVGKDELTDILKRVYIDPSSRPEDLSLSQFASIANTIG